MALPALHGAVWLFWISTRVAAMACQGRAKRQWRAERPKMKVGLSGWLGLLWCKVVLGA